MTQSEYLERVDALYEKYNPKTMDASEYPYLAEELLELFLDYKGGDVDAEHQ